MLTVHYFFVLLANIADPTTQHRLKHHQNIP